jgi:sugar O-acyltransferase (sialic acid O-acetyltransferase NeuD family)
MHEKMIRERLIIVGASGFGREVLCWAMQIPESQRTWDIAGFLDDRKSMLDGLNISAGILGGPSDYIFRENDRVVVALGDPAQRRKYAAIIAGRGARFTSIIHPTVVMGLNNTWGVGCIFCPGVIISTNVKIGDHVIFNCQATAGHDSQVGDYCTLSSHADITGYSKLEDEVVLCSHAAVLPHALVGRGAVVGAASAVLKRANPYSTVIGVPAREVWARPTDVQT